MATAPLDVARASYREISLYAPNRAPARIDLSDNTNLWGVPPAAARAIREAVTGTVTRYPNLYCDTLKGAMAAYLSRPVAGGAAPSIDAPQIVTGCGSDDVLDSAIRALAEPGDLVAYPDPSFAMIPIFARMNGLRATGVPLVDGTTLDPDAMLATGARIIYLCSPNNPTGNATTREAISAVVDGAPGVVIVDEAYAEFAGWSALDLIATSERVLVTRTLSKAFGLAGLRVGYAAGSPALIAEVEKSRGPYKVNAIAEAAAIAALTEDLPWVLDHVDEAKAVRARLIDALRAIGLAPLPSDANFILVPVPDAPAIATTLRSDGIALRPFTALPTIGHALRIGVGPWTQMEEAVHAIARAL